MVETFMALISVLLLGFSALTAYMLKKKLASKFYSYTNIVLIAGYYFIGIFFIVSLIYTIRVFAGGGEISYYELFRMIVEFPKRFSLFAVPIVVLICFGIFISNIFLIKHEGFRVFNLLGAVMGMVFIVMALLVNGFGYASDYLIDRFIGFERGHILMSVSSVIYTFMVTMLCYFECIYAATVVLAYIAVRHRPAYDKDYMIILGCSIDKRGGLLPLLKQRTNTAIHFAWEQEIANGKSMKYVPSGGQGPNEVISEGSAMEMYLLSHGAEEYEVLAEKRSRTTYENFAFSKELIDKEAPGAKVAFATTNYHILRSGILARYAGLDAEGIAAPTKWYFWPNGFVREFVAIVALKKKVHIRIAAIVFIVSAVLGVIGEMGWLH